MKPQITGELRLFLENSTYSYNSVLFLIQDIKQALTNEQQRSSDFHDEVISHLQTALAQAEVLDDNIIKYKFK